MPRSSPRAKALMPFSAPTCRYMRACPSRAGILLVVALLLALAPAPSSVASQATPGATPAAEAEGPTSTAIVVSSTNDPLRVAGSDGSDHLEYDLLVTNAFVAPVTLTSIDVLAPDGETLLRLAGDPLVQATQPLAGEAPTEEIAASGTVAVVIDVIVPPDRALEALTHRIVYDIAPDAPARSLIGSFVVDGPVLTVDPRQAIVLAPPLRGDGWVNGSGCCSTAARHRTARIAVDGGHIGKQETFAIDWVRLQDGRLFAGDGSRNEDWFGFGAEVLAVADGTVVAVQDGMPEEVPLQAAMHVDQPGDFGGNSVILEIAPGVYGFYAHLQPGSITVQVGDRVTTGQVLGLLGNTGNSGAPHLHFGLNDDIDPIVANSLPMVFDHWTLSGTVELEPFLDPSWPTLSLVGTPSEQADTLQLFLDVADFG